MKKIDSLRAIKTKPALAVLLGVKAQFLTHTLYVLKPATQYKTFQIKKKNGEIRTISAPLGPFHYP
ncbi:hypothetical protein [Vogesella fluminis]|uniref:Uncharacterized protein n=1 Tax=Vogesella fluminis TaxID=1069161 RepID=A0ABQ3HCM6_9NEIS|nr:hypothetical protein [Vogesella fluminis]GHD82306.1 hypothetical protein GCM10011419_29640 [Vogesella fluminis]